MLFYGIARRSSQPLLPGEFVRLTLGVFKPTLRYAQKILKRLRYWVYHNNKAEQQVKCDQHKHYV